MGCTQSAEDAEAIKRSKDLEHQIANDYQTEAAKIKLLLLGAGESGKSTIFKQMKKLYGKPITAKERAFFTQHVHVNIVEFMRALCDQVEMRGELSMLSEEEQAAFNSFGSLRSNERIGPESVPTIRMLWESAVFQSVWAKRGEFQIVESHKKFVEDIEHIATEDYVVSHDDMLLVRVKTTGVITEKYTIDGINFELYDVGGQRNERKKWIHCFEDVTAVLFVAALSEYDQVLEEDSSANRMVEALQLFEDICNKNVFDNASMLLLLNKRDLFAEKIRRVDIISRPEWSDYQGPPQDYNAGVEYFLQKFCSLSHKPDRAIYHHVTCATDTQNIEFVWGACRDTILNANLRQNGFD